MRDAVAVVRSSCPALFCPFSKVPHEIIDDLS